MHRPSAQALHILCTSYAPPRPAIGGVAGSPAKKQELDLSGPAERSSNCAASPASQYWTGPLLANRPRRRPPLQLACDLLTTVDRHSLGERARFEVVSLSLVFCNLNFVLCLIFWI